MLSVAKMPEFKKLIAKLRKHYGAPTMPPGSVIFAPLKGLAISFVREIARNICAAFPSVAGLQQT